MFQIQPRFSEKEKWQEIAEKYGLRYEILEFSSAYLNGDVTGEMINWYKGSGIADSLHGVFMDNYPVSPDHAIRKVSREKCEESCRQALDVGAENVVFHSTALTFVRKGYEASWGKDAAEYYEELADRFKLNIFVENFADVDMTPFVELMKNVKGDRVKLCLDVGHVNYTRKPLKDWIESLGDKVGYLHLSDNTGSWDDHDILGLGNVDFKLVKAYLEKRGSDMPITIEVPTIEAVVRSVEYLKSIGINI